jgi:hypothetical protein
MSGAGSGSPYTGAPMNMFEVTTLGQPLEVLKTQMAANRSQTMAQAFSTVWSRGGVAGFYQGLIPWVRARLPRESLSTC